jgi:Cu2+-containing amine oxidase
MDVQEPKALTREEREKAIKASIRRKERKRKKWQEIADNEGAELNELYRELGKIVREEAAEYDAKIAAQDKAITDMQGEIVEKNKPKGA